MKVNNRLFLYILLTGLFSGCEKYDEGGRISNADKKITESLWKIETATDLEDGTDITSDFAGEIWQFEENGTFKINAQIEGTYSFSADMRVLYISNTNMTEAEVYTIDRLDSDAMWLVMPMEHELHFIPN